MERDGSSSGTAGRDERLAYIVRKIGRERFVSLREISEQFGVNMQTARRDVSSLEGQRLVRRVHGGAVAVEEPDALSVEERLGIHDAEKRRIAEAAASFVHDGDVLFLDGGSTTAYLAHHLLGMQLHVVTNSVSLVGILGRGWPGVETNLTGGYYFPKSELLLGPPALQAIEQVQVDRAFLSAAGVTAEGVFNANSLVAEVEQAVIARAAETYLLVDPSKLGRASLKRVCGLESITALITTSTVPKSIAEAARAGGCRVLSVTGQSKQSVISGLVGGLDLGVR